jgi:hypothetical protein
MWMLIGQNFFAQPTNSEEVDDSTYVELIEVAPRKTLVIPPFQLINPDTLKLGEHDELVCDSYTAMGMPYVYDALHSFNARRMDKFGGYLNVKINQGLESIRKKGFNSDVKQLYIQVNPKTLTVHWVAVVGPSEDGKCYVRIDSRGSAGGGLPAVNKQLPRMHNLYPTLTAVKLLEFNENVIKCYDWNGNPLDSVCSFVNIRQHLQSHLLNHFVPLPFFQYIRLTLQYKFPNVLVVLLVVVLVILAVAVLVVVVGVVLVGVCCCSGCRL